jgi:hypothetical protein
MMVKRTTGWVAFAVAYLALSAVAEPTRRVKGLHRQAQQQRRLDTENKYKQPGILRAFGGVVCEYSCFAVDRCGHFVKLLNSVAMLNVFSFDSGKMLLMKERPW